MEILMIRIRPLLALATFTLISVAVTVAHLSGRIENSEDFRNVGERFSPANVQTLCADDELNVFSCPVKRTGKIVSLCTSKDFAKDSGYITYRFGLPGKVELEFPHERTATQKAFYYAHYFRARFDQTEISFNSGDYNYRMFDYYQGETKPYSHTQGLIVTPPGTKRSSTTLECAMPAKADYSTIGDILPCDPDSTINPGGCQ